jgi:histidyl-tRNA synthetase
LIVAFDQTKMSDYFAVARELRTAGVAAEVYLGASGMKAQMKYADRRDAPLAIIQGGDEKARGVVQVKDLVAGKKLAGKLADHDAYREARPGQEEIAEADLVEAVNRMLGRGERRP